MIWGAADTVLYYYNGRATTLTEAFLTHGGEALPAGNVFVALSDQNLRTPTDPAKDLLNGADGQGLLL